MLSPGERAVLAALKAALVERFGARLSAVLLFGSRARGEGRDDSDLDVLVDVRDVTSKERGDIIDIAADLSLAHDLLLSPLVLRDDRARLPKRIFEDAVSL